MTAPRPADAGLTLVEVLVSLAIFAVIGVAGLTVLNGVARTGERTEGRLERLAEIDRAFLVIRRDLAQVTRAELLSDGKSLTFDRAQQSGSVKLTYHLKDNVLIRQVNIAGSESVDQELLSDVAAMGWRVMDRTLSWQAEWPLAERETPGRPRAAELSLDILRENAATADTVVRLFPLPGGVGQ